MGAWWAVIVWGRCLQCCSWEYRKTLERSLELFICINRYGTIGSHAPAQRLLLCSRHMNSHYHTPPHLCFQRKRGRRRKPWNFLHHPNQSTLAHINNTTNNFYLSSRQWSLWVLGVKKLCALYIIKFSVKGLFLWICNKKQCHLQYLHVTEIFNINISLSSQFQLFSFSIVFKISLTISITGLSISIF